MVRYLFFLILLSTSCSKEETALPSAEAKTMINLKYGGDVKQSFDAYLPPGRNTSTTKSIILIHGGGWTGGDKSASTPFVDTLKRRLPDYAIFNLNYRLSDGVNNIFPAQEEDIRNAVNYIHSNRNEYGISEKFVLAGESAGGHLAMLHAYKNPLPVKIKAVVSFFGPSDLLDMYNNPVNGNTFISMGLAQAIGATPVQDPDIYYNSSPVNFINTSSAVPTILFHGGNDPLVSPTQSIAVKEALNVAGSITDYTLYPGKGHGDDWDPSTFNDAFNKIVSFLNAYVQ